MLEKLQNGSDIRGVAITTADKEANLTEKAVKAIGAGFVKYLKLHFGIQNPKVAIGYDSRITAKTMQSFFASGVIFADKNAQVLDTGLSSTPAMFMSTVRQDGAFNAGVMITASHLPYERNGFKLFTDNGGFEKSDIKAVLELSENEFYDIEDIPTIQSLPYFNIMDDYCEYLKKVIIKTAGVGDKPLSGAKIIIDAGNGAGGFFEEKVLRALGADTTGSIFTEPDGYFPNHAPNPEDSAAMECISNAVIKSKAELGIIFDTDVDRAAVVTDEGKEINRNRLIALMLKILQICGKENAVIVTDSITSTGLAEFIKENGATHIRYKRGYKNVINEAKKRCANGENACLAIETSGHGAINDNYFLDDGAYMIALIVGIFAKKRAQGKKLSELIETLKEPKEAIEIRLKITSENFIDYGNKVLSELESEIKKWEGYSALPENYEGIRVNVDRDNGDGWFLLRLSLHDPVLPLNIESDSVGGVDKIKRKLFDFLSSYEFIKE